MTKRKPVRLTIEPSRPRDVFRGAEGQRQFPTARELSKSQDWKRWLTQNLRTLLAPTVLAAASLTGGCDQVGQFYADVLTPPPPHPSVVAPAASVQGSKPCQLPASGPSTVLPSGSPPLNPGAPRAIRPPVEPVALDGEMAPIGFHHPE